MMIASGNAFIGSFFDEDIADMVIRVTMDICQLFLRRTTDIQMDLDESTDDNDRRLSCRHTHIIRKRPKEIVSYWRHLIAAAL